MNVHHSRKRFLHINAEFNKSLQYGTRGHLTFRYIYHLSPQKARICPVKSFSNPG